MAKHIHIHTAALLKPRVNKTKDGQKPYLSLNTRYQEWEVLNSENKVAMTFPKSERAEARAYLRNNYKKLEQGFVDDSDGTAKRADATFTKYDPREVARLKAELADIGSQIVATKGPISKRDLENVREKLKRELAKYHDAAMAPADKAALQKLVAEIRNTLAHVSGDINAGSISPQTRSSARTLKMSVATLVSDIESFRD